MPANAGTSNRSSPRTKLALRLRRGAGVGARANAKQRRRQRQPGFLPPPPPPPPPTPPPPPFCELESVTGARVTARPSGTLSKWERRDAAAGARGHARARGLGAAERGAGRAAGLSARGNGRLSQIGALPSPPAVEKGAAVYFHFLEENTHTNCCCSSGFHTPSCLSGLRRESGAAARANIH